MDTNSFFEELKKNGLDFFCGVPDSLLKNFCACIKDKVSYEKNIIAANEGNAIAIAAGHYLATEKPAVVYMQNSGEGNAVNPLLSLTDKEVYDIPVLLIIGWRGEPDKKDEPQHIKQGKVTLSLLDVIGIKYEILEDISQVSKAVQYIKKTNNSFAFIVRKGLFDTYKPQTETKNKYISERETAINAVLEKLSDTDIVVSTTGMISRELYENRQTHEKDFLTVGSMGHASSIAFGVALEKTNRKVFCFDGDGALLMHMGAVGVIASRNLKNFRHILFNNEVHDSVGGQPTVADKMNFSEIVKASGYTSVYSVTTIEELEKVWSDFYNNEGTNFLEIKVKSGHREDLGRPKEKPAENKKVFTEYLRDK